VGYIDRCLLPNHLLYSVGFDPEGLLSTLPAIVTAMLGQFTGEFVKDSDRRHKTLWMLLAAAVLLVLGLIWSNWLPINKKLWTSSFTLVVGAFSLAMYALFYWIIDIKGYTKWTFFFQVIGMNSITIYMLQKILPFSAVNRFFFEGLVGLVPEPVGKVIYAVGYIGWCWLLLWFLYKKRVFLKV
jgi:predicted acyltransferase